MAKSAGDLRATQADDQVRQEIRTETNASLRELRNKVRQKDVQALIEATPYLSELGLPTKLTFSPILEAMEKGFHVVSGIIDKITEKNKKSLSEEAQIIIARKAFAAHQIISIIEKYNRSVELGKTIDIGEPNEFRLNIFQSAVHANQLILEAGKHAKNIKSFMGEFKSKIEGIATSIKHGFRPDKKIAKDATSSEETDKKSKNRDELDDDVAAAKKEKEETQKDIRDELAKSLFDEEQQKAYSSAVDILKQSTSVAETLQNAETAFLVNKIKSTLTPKFDEKKAKEYTFAVEWVAFDKHTCRAYKESYAHSIHTPDHTEMTDRITEEIAQDRCHKNSWYDLAKKYASFQFVAKEDESLNDIDEELASTPNGARSIKPTDELISKIKSIGPRLASIQRKLEAKEVSREADEQISPIKAYFVKETLKKLDQTIQKLNTKLKGMRAHSVQLYTLRDELKTILQSEEQYATDLELDIQSLRKRIDKKGLLIKKLEHEHDSLKEQLSIYEAYEQRPADYEPTDLSDAMTPIEVDKSQIRSVVHKLEQNQTELNDLLKEHDKMKEDLHSKKALSTSAQKVSHYLRTGDTSPISEKELFCLKKAPLNSFYKKYMTVLGAGHEHFIEDILDKKRTLLLEELTHVEESIQGKMREATIKPRSRGVSFFKAPKTTLLESAVGQKNEDILNAISKCKYALTHPKETVYFNIVDFDAFKVPALSSALEMLDNLKGESYLSHNVRAYRTKLEALFAPFILSEQPNAKILYHFLYNNHSTPHDDDVYLDVQANAQETFCLSLKEIQNIKSDESLMKVYHRYCKVTGSDLLKRHEEHIQDQFKLINKLGTKLFEKFSKKGGTSELLALVTLKRFMETKISSTNAHASYTWGNEDPDKLAALELDRVHEYLQKDPEICDLYDRYKEISGKDPVGEWLAHQARSGSQPKHQ